MHPDHSRSCLFQVIAYIEPCVISLEAVLPDGEVIHSDPMKCIDEWLQTRWYNVKGSEVFRPLLFGLLDECMSDSDESHLHWHACGDCGGEWLGTLLRSVPHVGRIVFP